MSRTAYLPQLVFSTRARHPRGGADFVREIVAATPGVDEAVRGDFYRRADIVGRVLQTELGQPIYTFSPVPANGWTRWLFARTVPIGEYRKGHQLLTHGILLERWHLEALAGNPFLLVDQDRGEPFCGDHPGAHLELPLLPIKLPAGPGARDANARRLERLAGELAERDRDLPALLDGLARGAPVLYVTAAPRPALAEWLLLHLHPDDRPELSFHTWYGHGREVPYRLLLVPPEDLREVRPQFQSASVVEEGRMEPMSPSGLGELALELRRGSSTRYLDTLRRYRMTFLAEGGEHPPLSPIEAVLAFRAAVGATLTEEEERRLHRLRTRGEVEDPGEEVAGLADAWLHERASFGDRLREAAAEIPPLPPEPLRRAAEITAADLPARRWALLALLAADSPRGPLTTDRGRREAWRRLTAGKEADRLLAFLSDGPAGGLERRAVPILAAYVAAAAWSGRPEEHARLAPAASALIESGEAVPILPAPAVGALAAGMLSVTAEALAWRSRHGVAPPGVRRLDRWLAEISPRLGAEAAAAAGELLGACCAIGAPELAAASIAHLRRAAEDNREALLAAALGAAAERLTAPLAAAPGGGEMLPVLAGLAQLLGAAGDGELPHGQAVARDAALAAACLPAMAGVHAAEDLAALGPPIPDQPLAALRGGWLRLLSRAYHGGAATEVFADRRWLDLLEDDLRRHPRAGAPEGVEGSPEMPVHDPRRPVLLHLAWSHWGAAATHRADGGDAARRAAGRLLRLARGKAAAHRQAFRAVLAEDLHGPAEELLTPFRPLTGAAAADARSPG